MTNDQRPKKSEARMSNCSELCGRRFRHSDFVIPSDFVIRHSGLKITVHAWPRRFLTAHLEHESRRARAPPRPRPRIEATQSRTRRTTRTKGRFMEFRDHFGAES